jgi:hypothetical protein
MRHWRIEELEAWNEGGMFELEAQEFAGENESDGGD